MADHVNRQFRLAARPVGRVKSTDFTLHEAPDATPGPNQAVARILYLSLDPTNRIWMSDMDQYMPPVELGEIMRGSAVGQIVASNRADYAVGDLVTGLLGWQDYCLISDGALPLPFKLPPAPVRPSTFLGVLGLTGVTAYFGLHDVGRPQQGDTVVVSAAAGAVGSIAGQLAKLHGCRVVGIAGSDDKCDWLTGELGFDAAINYRHPEWKAQLRAACPD
ncbi:MAG TPA: NADP-dependent oxidoreductase, partial [Candidatus Tumulicola sp.]|nr:NADP-dependent oxidoreductase [Candidatus Tumulicola sp.]